MPLAIYQPFLFYICRKKHFASNHEDCVGNDFGIGFFFVKAQAQKFLVYLERPLPSKTFLPLPRVGFLKSGIPCSQVGILLALTTKKARIIVFRFIIEYSSLKGFWSLDEDFWKMIFLLVLKLQISSRVIVS
jgi:hypothetical protein